VIIPDIPRRNAKRYSDKTAVIFENTRYTFKELNDRVNSMANALADMGLKKGDKIIIIADNCNQYLDMLWVAAKAGLAISSPNPQLSRQQLSQLINSSGARAIIMGGNYRDLVKSLRPELEEVESYIVIGASDRGIKSYEELVSSYSPSEPRVEVGDEDLLFLAFSGGTTGAPKQIMHTHRSLLGMTLDLTWVYDTRHEDVFLFAVSPFWAHLIPYIMIPASYLGCTLVITKEITPPTILRVIEREKVTTIWLGTPVLPQLVELQQANKYDCSSLRRVVLAGTSLPTEIWQRAIKTFGNVFGQIYGSTEMSPISFLPPEEFVFEGPPEKTKRLRSCGREALNVEARVVNEVGNDVRSGEVGEVIARGESMMKGYLNAPRLTEETIKGGYLYTGDLGTIDEEGYIYLVGRKKDAIMTQGKLISSSEIEDIIYRHPAVLEAAVIGVPDKELGEAVKAVIVPREGKRITEQEIVHLCEQNLPPYAVPKSVDFVSSLPKSPVGKTLKYALREKYTKP
jgi:acyl-coenzyme A synthetase/AMP-(fatty) acid ligase